MDSPLDFLKGLIFAMLALRSLLIVGNLTKKISSSCSIFQVLGPPEQEGRAEHILPREDENVVPIKSQMGLFE